MAVRTLLKKLSTLCILMLSLNSEAYINTQQAHQIIKEQYHDLLGDGRDLVSLYFFGSERNTTVIGLERVGDNFLPVRWLLIFEGETLLGWYHPVVEFPKKFFDGILQFPKGLNADKVMLKPNPQSEFKLQDKTVQFKPVSRAIRSSDNLQ